MRRILSIVLATSSSLVAVPSDAQLSRPSAATLAASVDSLARVAMAAGLTPALGVAIVMDGRTIYNRAFGMADPTAGIRADSSTLWYIASTSKSLTGMGIALLAADGTIDINAPITTLLPKAKWHPDARPSELTLASFLTHTQGLSAGAVVMNAAFTGNIPEAKWPELLAYSEPLPTRDMIYNNLGYNVAAMVIDTKRPEGWKRFLERSVYAPVGMRETYARVSGLDRRRIAMPSDIDRTLRFATRPFVKTDATMNAAGGHLSTLGDLARWVIVNMQDGRIDGRQVLPAKAVQLAHRQLAPQTVTQSMTFGPFKRDGWGIGWDIGSYDGEPMVSRFGGYESIRSHLSYLPSRHIGVVAQATASTGSALTDLIAAYAYDLEAGRPNARERAESRLQSAIAGLNQVPARIAASDSITAVRRSKPLAHPLEGYVGVYENAGYGAFTVTMKDGALWYTYGAYSGPVDIYNAPADQLRIVLGGSGTVVSFHFGSAATAESADVGTDRGFVRVNSAR